MGNYIFHKDLQVSKKTEHKVAEVLSLMSNTKIKMLNNTKDFDIMLEHKGRDFFIEVKEDFMASKTGNIAVEYECRGKPSGIEVSQANVYAYVIHNGDVQELYLTEVSKLKEAIAKKKYHRKVVGGDFKSNTKMYLFRKDVFTSMSKKVCEFRETKKS